MMGSGRTVSQRRTSGTVRFKWRGSYAINGCRYAWSISSAVGGAYGGIHMVGPVHSSQRPADGKDDGLSWSKSKGLVAVRDSESRPVHMQQNRHGHGHGQGSSSHLQPGQGVRLPQTLFGLGGLVTPTQTAKVQGRSICRVAEWGRRGLRHDRGVRVCLQA